MARETRRPASSLSADLSQQPRRYSFVQALRLLRRQVRRNEGGADEDTLQRRLQVRPELSFDFPATDLTAIEELAGDPPRYRITATFLGLYGTSSPLPTFYTEDLLREQGEDRSITREFMDIINSPIYDLFFRCWSKYQLAFQVVEEENSAMLNRLYCLLGLENEHFRHRTTDPYRLLRYIGLTTQSPRSAAGLHSLLADALALPRLVIEQCVERSARISPDQRLLLGQQAQVLGENSVLGEQCRDRAGKFRVVLGMVTEADLHRFLPDQPAFKEMTELIEFYLDQPLEWDLEMTMAPETVEPVVLGADKWSRLGWNTWLFSGSPPQEPLTVRLNAPQHKENWQ